MTYEFSPWILKIEIAIKIKYLYISKTLVFHWCQNFSEFKENTSKEWKTHWWRNLCATLCWDTLDVAFQCSQNADWALKPQFERYCNNLSWYTRIAVHTLEQYLFHNFLLRLYLEAMTYIYSPNNFYGYTTINHMSNFIDWIVIFTKK